MNYVPRTSGHFSVRIKGPANDTYSSTCHQSHYLVNFSIRLRFCDLLVKHEIYFWDFSSYYLFLPFINFLVDGKTGV